MIPKYLQLKEELNTAISQDIYPIGSHLPTENDLAKKYSVSRSTVREALSLLEQEGVIEKKWGSGNTVLKKSLSSKKDTILFLLPNLTDKNYKTLSEELYRLFQKEGYSLEVHCTDNHYSTEREFLQELTRETYCGLITAPVRDALPSPNTDLLQILLRRQFPVIFIGSSPVGLYNTTIIRMDSYDKGYRMARKLINSGQEKIGGIFRSDSMDSVTAYQGFLDAIRDASLPIMDKALLLPDSTTDKIHLPEGFPTAAEIFYLDDSWFQIDSSLPVVRCDFEEKKSMEREIFTQFMAQKKNGNGKSVTIPYR